MPDLTIFEGPSPESDLLSSYRLLRYGTVYGLDWTAYSDRTTLEYDSLDDGSYTFELKVKDEVGNITMKSIDFLIYDEFHDTFEDGVIDTGLWVVGGQNGAVGVCGSGGGQWFNEEIVGGDGYLQARVTCPGATNTIGSDSWIRTVHDFNDGNDWIINFRWETDIQTVGQWHADYHLIEITNGRTDWGGCYYHPPLSQVLPGTQQLFYSNGQDFGPTTWSIVINASAAEATLFEGPNGTGAIHSTKELDNGVTWYVRFITSTATSGGFPAKDCRLNLYDFTTTRN
jgi:hypothetical protein